MAFDYDLFVIGGGSGGVRAARTAAASRGEGGAGRGKPDGRHLRDPWLRAEEADGLRVEIRPCLRGCRRLWLGATSRAASTGPPSAPSCTPSLTGWKRSTAEMLGKSDVKIFDSRATLDDPHTVKLANGRTVSAKHILVATGGHPVRPDLPCAELGLVSDDIFLLEDAAQVDPDRRRRLYRLRIRLHLERPGRRGDAVLPRRADPARL